MGNQVEEQTSLMNRIEAWTLACRPKTLTGAAAPVLIGGAMALQMGATNSLLQFLLCLLFAFVMQIDANFVNDYFDFKKGTDREDRLGPERACAQGWIKPENMKKGIIITTILACIIGISLMVIVQQWELVIIGIMCVIFCFLYTTSLSYLGLGDLLVLVFFGIVPVGFTFYTMTDGAWTTSLTFAGIAMGLATDNLLIVNNYRDRNEDKTSGKLTIIVRLIKMLGKEKGEKFCQRLYLWIGITATLFAFAAIGLKPSLSIMLIYPCLHVIAYKRMRNLDGRELNKLLGETARNIFLFGALLATSVLI